MFVAYIYDPFWNKITQVFSLNKLNATIKLNEISEANFEISPSIKEANFSTFKGWNKIKINWLENKSETKIIEGVISLVTAQDTIQVQVKDYNFLFQKKKILSDLTLNGPLNDFIVSLMSTINSRQDTGFSVDCDVSDVVSLDTFKKGSSVYDVLKKIADAGYEYTFSDRKLILKKTIGSDRTSGPNYFEFNFDINEIRRRTIRNDKQMYNSSNLANVIYDQNGNVLEDQNSIAEFGRIEDWITTSATQTQQAYLNDRKQLVKEIEITPIKTYFSDVELGDVVKCYIKKESDIQYFNGSVKIVEKRITGSDLKKTEIKVSKGSVKTLDLFETIKQLQDKQKQLEL